MASDGDSRSTDTSSKRDTDPILIPENPIASPGCEPLQLCGADGCRLDIRPPAPVAQDVRIDWRDAQPPADWTGSVTFRPSNPADNAFPNLLGVNSVGFDGRKETNPEHSTVYLFPGAYDAFWRGWPEQTGFEYPVRSPLEANQVPSESPLFVTADRPAPSTVDLTVRFNGQRLDRHWSEAANPGEFPYRSWTVGFRDPASNEIVREVEGRFDQKHRSVKVYPMTYDVYFRINRDHGLDPIDQSDLKGAVPRQRRVAVGFDATEDRSLEVNPHTVRLHGTLTLDGKPLSDFIPNEDPPNWELIFHARESGQRFDQPLARQKSYEASIYPGRYDIYLKAQMSPGLGHRHPYEQPIPVVRNVVIDQDTRRDIELETHSATIVPYWNGEPAAGQIADFHAASGYLQLRAPGYGPARRTVVRDRLRGPGQRSGQPRRYRANFGPGEGTNATFEHVPPGTYELWGSLPGAVGTTRLAKRVEVNASGASISRVDFQTFDIPTSIHPAERPDGELPFRPRLTLQPVRYRQTHPLQDDAPPGTLAIEPHEFDRDTIPVYAGNYDVFFEFRDIFETGSRQVVARGWQPSPRARLDVQIPIRRLRGQVTWPDNPVPEGDTSLFYRNLIFVSRTTDRWFQDRLDGDETSYQVDAFRGIYDVYFNLRWTVNSTTYRSVDIERRIARCVEIR